MINIIRPSLEDRVPTLGTPYVDVHGILDEILKLILPNGADVPPANVILNSLHGLGKSLLAHTLAIEAGKKLKKPVPLVVVECSEDTREYHLRGSAMQLPDGSTGFVLGPMPLAIELANEAGFCILNVEEISKLPPGTQGQFNAMTDWRRSVDIPQLGKQYRLEQGCHVVVVATMNPCFHPDTDVLTPAGIRRIEDMHAGDLIYSFNQETGEAEIDVVEQIWCQPCTNGLLHIEGNTCDLLITPNHKLLWKLQGREMAWRLDEAQAVADRRVDLPKPYALPMTSTRIDATDSIDLKELGLLLTEKDWTSHKSRRTRYLMVDLCRLLGWYVADGSLSFNEEKQDYKICITKYADTQPTRRNIEEHLTRMGVSFYADGDGFVISDKVLFRAVETLGGRLAEFKKIHPWILENADKLHLRALFDAAYECDGRNSPTRHGDCYSTKSPELRDAMTWVANVLGYATSWGFDSGIHRITLSEQRKASAPKHYFQPVEYKGMVINLSVKNNHTLFAGRNGRFVAVGNSMYGGVYNLNIDLRSRFNEYIVPLPDAKQEAKILKTICPWADGTLIENACRLAKDTRTDATEYKISTRDLVQLIQNVKRLGNERSPLQLLANKYEEGQERDLVKDRIDAVFSVKVV